jgi:hypothetical protein
MPGSFGKNLEILLAAAEKRKYSELRAQLRIPETSTIPGLQLEFLAHQLLDPSELTLHVKYEAGILQVGDSRSTGRLPYRGEAMNHFLSLLKISLEEAKAGITIRIKNGIRL